MRKKHLLPIMALCASLLTGCATSTPTGFSTLISPTYPASTSYENSLNKEMDKTLDSNYVNAIKNFSLKTGKLLLNTTDNANYSPISLYMALSLLTEGSAGTTQEELLQLLDLTGKDLNYLAEQNATLFETLYTNNEVGKLLLANSLWITPSLSVKDSYLDRAKKDYYASVFQSDFSKPETADKMSKWVADNTNNLIKPEMKADPNYVMAILNTVYYYDEWSNDFNEDLTAPDTFTMIDGEQVTCDFMNAEYDHQGYIVGDNYVSTNLYMKNGTRMSLVLPNEGTSLNDILANDSLINEVTNYDAMETAHIVLELPKFTFDNKYSLNETLQTLGAKSCFSDNADFSNLTKDSIFLSNASQETHIAIDEKGVEAAAFTELEMADTAMPPEEEDTVEMKFTRPFLYVITSSDDIPLFIGVVNQP